MIELAANLIEEYNISFWGNDRIFVDGANPSFIRALKARVGESTTYEDDIVRWKSDNGANVVTLDWLINTMFVLPVPFSKEHKRMLAHTKSIVESNGRSLAINPKFIKLITALRTAMEIGEGSLDKEATSHDDLFDSFRLSLQFWH